MPINSARIRALAPRLLPIHCRRLQAGLDSRGLLFIPTKFRRGCACISGIEERAKGSKDRRRTSKDVFQGSDAIGRHTSTPQSQAPRRWNPRLTLSFHEGKHFIKIEFEYLKLQTEIDDLSATIGAMGFVNRFTGRAMGDFLLGLPSQLALTSLTLIDQSQPMYFYFVQDEMPPLQRPQAVEGRFRQAEGMAESDFRDLAGMPCEISVDGQALKYPRLGNLSGPAASRCFNPRKTALVRLEPPSLRLPWAASFQIRRRKAIFLPRYPQHPTLKY
jgi:hypothetical protein